MSEAARLERLFNLCALLVSTRRPVTLAEIADEVPGYSGGRESVRRAFERDKESLRGIGVPIAVERVEELVDEVGYRVRPEDYYLPELDLTDDERAALHMAATAVELGDDSWRAGMWKLGGLAGEAAPPFATLRREPALAPLLEACGTAASVTFSYRGQVREVDPEGLAMERGRWYLAGFDRGREARRTFRLDRIEALQVGSPGSSEQRERATPTGPGQRPWELEDGPAEIAEVFIDRAHAPWAVTQLGEDAVVRRDERGIVVRMEVAGRAAFRSFVLGLLDGAEVLSPPKLRAEIVEWVAHIASGEDAQA